jgi:hypothetical protein
MTLTLHATFDGEVLRPEERLGIPPNTRLLVTIQSIEEAPSSRPSFLNTARSLNLEGPPDWSSRLGDYLHEHKVSAHE